MQTNFSHCTEFIYAPTLPFSMTIFFISRQISRSELAPIVTPIQNAKIVAKNTIGRSTRFELVCKSKIAFARYGFFFHCDLIIFATGECNFTYFDNRLGVTNFCDETRALIRKITADLRFAFPHRQFSSAFVHCMQLFAHFEIFIFGAREMKDRKTILDALNRGK